jgi:hypothetical protein
VTVPRRQTGVVQNDLTCAPAGVGVVLEHGAKLDLNGHTLDGCSIAASDEQARISVRGPGTVIGGGISIRAGVPRVQDVFIDAPPTFGICGNTGAGEGPSTLKLPDVTVDDSGLAGIWAPRVIGLNVNVTGGGVRGFGVARSAVILIASIVTGNDANGVAEVVPWGVCAND